MGYTIYKYISLSNIYLRFLHVFSWLYSSFSLFSFWMYRSIFIHSPTEGRLGCFQVLAIMNKAVINIHVQAFMWTKVFSSFG